MRFARTVPSVLLVLILSINLAFFQMALVVYRKATQPEFYLSRFESSGFYDDLQSYAYDKTRDGIDRFTENFVVGIPSERVLENAIARNWIVSQTNSFVTGIFDFLNGRSRSLPYISYEPVIQKIGTNIGGILDEIDPGINLKDTFLDAITKTLEELSPELPFSHRWKDVERRQFALDMEWLRNVFQSLGTGLVVSALLSLVLTVILGIISKRMSVWRVWIGSGLMLAGLLSTVGFLLFMSRLRLGLSGWTQSHAAGFPSVQPMMDSIMGAIRGEALSFAGISVATGLVLILVPFFTGISWVKNIKR